MSAELVMDQVESQSPVTASLPKVGYSMKEAQTITGLGKTTLWEAIANGKLKCFKVGRRTLFSMKHLEDFMALHDTNGREVIISRKRRRK